MFDARNGNADKVFTTRLAINGPCMQALTQYRDNDHARLRSLFASGRSVKEGFGKILLGIDGESQEEHERGYLLLSANMERDAKDKVIAEFLLDNQLKTETIFTEALRRAQGGGELSDKQDPSALARFFVATIRGCGRWPSSTRIVKRSNRSQD